MAKSIERVVIAIPNTRWFGNRHSPTFPYAQGIINASLKNRYDVKILDADLENLSSDQVRGSLC